MIGREMDYGLADPSLWAGDGSSLARTIYFNSTYTGWFILAGAGVVVLGAVGLYLYDYFFTPAATSKADQYYNPNTDPNYPYYQPSQDRRYISFLRKHTPFGKTHIFYGTFIFFQTFPSHPPHKTWSLKLGKKNIR